MKPYNLHGEYTGDYFSLNVDYPRVTGNLEYLAAQSAAQIQNMPEQQVTVEGPLSRIYNAIEKNIEQISQAIHKPADFPATKQWEGNMFAPTVDDWNRWENSALILNTYLTRMEQAKESIAFTLGGGFL